MTSHEKCREFLADRAQILTDAKDGRKTEIFISALARMDGWNDDGPGKGNWGHAGRPGHRGGSASKAGMVSGLSITTKPSRNAVPAKNKKVDSEEFVGTLDRAKATCDERKAWRVDTNRSPQDFDKEDIKMYSTQGGSTFAIKPDGDIISVCKNGVGDAKLNGRDLMAAAVERGGTHLDSYAGNYGFYEKCGFEVVSRCKFDEQWAPPGWKKGLDEPEDIYFMRYVGVGNVRDNSEASMKDRVPYSADYDEAAKVLETALRGEDDG